MLLQREGSHERGFSRRTSGVFLEDADEMTRRQKAGCRRSFHGTG